MAGALDRACCVSVCMYVKFYRPLPYFRRSGELVLNISWAERLVVGCPFKINVTQGATASKVTCVGAGLQGGMVGSELRTVIDTKRAGPGKSDFIGSLCGCSLRSATNAIKKAIGNGNQF